MNSVNIKVDNCVDCRFSRCECPPYDQGGGYDELSYYCTKMEDEGSDGFLGETKRRNNYISIPNTCPFIIKKLNIDKFFRYLEIKLKFNVIKDFPEGSYFRVNGLISNYGIDWVIFDQKKTELINKEFIVYLDKPSTVDIEDKESLYDYYTSNPEVNSISICSSFSDKEGRTLDVNEYLELKSIVVNDRSKNKI